MKKKLLSLLLAFCMLPALTPGGLTLAADEDAPTDDAFLEAASEYEEVWESDAPGVFSDEDYWLEAVTEEPEEADFEDPAPLTAVRDDRFALLAGAPTYDTSFVMNHVRIMIHVYDQDAAVLSGGANKIPVPGVEIGINRHTNQDREGFGPPRTVNNIFTLTSDENGIAYIDVPFTVVTQSNGRQLAYLNNIRDTDHLIFSSTDSSETFIFYDLGSISTGYYTNMVDGYIRNSLNGANGGAIAKKESGVNKYDDFFFHGGIVHQWTYNFADEKSGKPKPSGGYGGGAFIEFEVFVKSDNVTVSFEDKNVSGWNPADYPSQTMKAGGKATAPSKTPVNKVDPAIEFLGWANKSTGELFDFTKPVTTSVVLVPKWGPNPNVQGYIHLDSFLWNHDAYNGTYGTGWTTTPVRDMTYIVEYYDQTPAATGEKHTLATVTVDEYGQADFVVTPEKMEELRDFYSSVKKINDGKEHHVALDIGPSPDATGWHTTDSEQNSYSWDWETGGRGLNGVRTMKVNTDGVDSYNNDRDGTFVQGKNDERTTPVVGNVQYGSNENHVPWLTDSMMEDGFEFWWKVYVTPTMLVKFDLDGGSGSGNYADQQFEPISSIPGQAQKYKVAKPSDPSKSGKTFAGWFRVLEDGTTLEGTPWDFANRIVTKSMTLRAVYADKLYTVVFDPGNGGASQSKTYVTGGTPAWVGEDPAKAEDAKYTYTFEGEWQETSGASVGADYFFKDEYDFDHIARTIYGSKTDTAPVTVTASFADRTVYTAQYKATPKPFTLTYNLNGGSAAADFPAQSYNVDTGVTLHGGTPTKAGCVFAGWELASTSGDWTSKTYSAGETVSGRYGNTELRAKWNPLYRYKLNFSSNTTDSVSGMPTGLPETDWTEDSTRTVTWTTEPTRTDYTFLGWATSSGGSVAVPAGTFSYTMTGAASQLKEETLFAVWQINERPYKVNYLEQGTNKVLHEQKTDAERVGETVTEYAEEITGYELVSTDPQTLVISAAEADNVINFYYKEKTAAISYVALTADGGSVSRASENVPVLTGNPAGSVAEAKSGYRFVGWYKDEACKFELTKATTCTPVKNETTQQYEDAVYYAKFEPILGDLTVRKTGCESADADQSFIFHVTSVTLADTAHASVDLYVAVLGNGSVTITDLPIGSYEVEEESDWSWRYTADDDGIAEVELDADGESVTMENTRTNDKWFSGSACAVNTKSGRRKNLSV